MPFRKGEGLRKLSLSRPASFRASARISMESKTRSLYSLRAILRTMPSFHVTG
jgi:hypothetical protein